MKGTKEQTLGAIAHEYVVQLCGNPHPGTCAVCNCRLYICAAKEKADRFHFHCDLVAWEAIR
jgi:hypothetical protein